MKNKEEEEEEKKCIFYFNDKFQKIHFQKWRLNISLYL